MGGACLCTEWKISCHVNRWIINQHIRDTVCQSHRDTLTHKSGSETGGRGDLEWSLAAGWRRPDINICNWIRRSDGWTLTGFHGSNCDPCPLSRRHDELSSCLPDIGPRNTERPGRADRTQQNPTALRFWLCSRCNGTRTFHQVHFVSSFTRKVLAHKGGSLCCSGSAVVLVGPVPDLSASSWLISVFGLDREQTNSVNE